MYLDTWAISMASLRTLWVSTTMPATEGSGISLTDYSRTQMLSYFLRVIGRQDHFLFFAWP